MVRSVVVGSLVERTRLFPMPKRRCACCVLGFSRFRQAFARVVQFLSRFVQPNGPWSCGLVGVCRAAGTLGLKKYPRVVGDPAPVAIRTWVLLQCVLLCLRISFFCF